ncbi:hypothetical protein AB0I22_00040 [Streptomyces sp. NPDC050610]|uniref:hypothetical protein n=1 Tax=Streptomyces sp. NPDC050610 TaxID=3157097 RepID=UPI00343FD320
MRGTGGKTTSARGAALTVLAALVTLTLATTTACGTTGSARRAKGPVPHTFRGAWEGKVVEKGRETGRILRIDIGRTKHTRSVKVRTTGPRAYCQASGTFTRVSKYRLAYRARSTDSLPRKGSCEEKRKQSLRRGDNGTVSWKADGATAVLHRAPDGNSTVDSQYRGTWKSADAGLTITVKQGAIGTEAAKITRDSPGHHCTAPAYLASASRGSGGLVLSPMKLSDTEHPACPGSDTSLTLNASPSAPYDRNSLAAARLGGDAAHGTTLTRVKAGSDIDTQRGR